MSELTIGRPVGHGKARIAQKIRFLAHHRARMFAITFMSDMLALIVSTTFVHVSIYHTFSFDYLSMGEMEHLLFGFICLSLFMATRLYPGMGINPALEMKNVTQLTGVSFLIALGFLMIRTPLWPQEKPILGLIAGISVPAILGMRWLIRILAVQAGAWGEPVAIVASPGKLEIMMNYFNERRRLGFVPVLGAMSDDPSPSIGQQLRIRDLLGLPDEYFARNGIDTVLVSTQIISDLARTGIHQGLLQKFKRTIFVSDVDWLEGVSISYHDFEGMLGMEVQQNLLTLPDEMFKRVADVFLSLLLGFLCLPILVLTALCVRLDSPGPILYKQERLGKAGRRITIFKFRSMQLNAEKILADYLAKYPDAQREWNETQKLREDPRITRVGRWIRKFSVDELPQLLNILMGDMSIVGPRPIMFEQRSLYGKGLSVYTSVRPGLTGFWQVSGRSRTSFAQRAIYDVYYVRNWSLWLDMYILLRTVWVVLSRDGAY